MEKVWIMVILPDGTNNVEGTLVNGEGVDATNRNGEDVTLGSTSLGWEGMLTTNEEDKLWVHHLLIG